ncbi:MAG: DUF983 domain-containing protein [Rhodospirillales bacterium]|nr:DUF983 domain-containing protein [Rhodospirillales bacterium]
MSTSQNTPLPETEARSWTLGLRRGVACRCPNCGQTTAFSGFLSIKGACERCGHPLGEYRADDAPPYFTIFIVGHIIVGAMVALDEALPLPVWLQMTIWVPLTALLTLALIRPVKGAVLGVMWGIGLRS